MRTFKKVAIALAVVTIMAGPSMAGQLQTGGNVPLINTMVGVGVLSLDFSGPGTLVNIATFIVNCNDAQFDVAWTFANKGVFKTANGAQSIAMSDVTIEEGLATGNGGYIAGTGLTRTFVNGAPLSIYIAGADPKVTGNVSIAGTVHWTGETQSTATVNDEIFVNASWLSSQTALYGLYTEQITYSVTAL